MVLKNKVFHWRKRALLTVTQGVSLHGLEGLRWAWGLRQAPCCDQQTNEPSRACKGLRVSQVEMMPCRLLKYHGWVFIYPLLKVCLGQFISLMLE